ncbi:MAG: hypothetical protein QOD41_1872, partial [Cryptosporangiaceae bacterium]|nr:hypothetical protein [Cryptosporangiaceae bacterium]
PPAAAFDEVFRLTPRDPDGERAALPPVSDQYLVVDGDATQLAAIARARTGASYLIQGPPGTGKSQTITNLIADQVARGRRVLFVCEKRAAIDVVYHRLRQRGLDGLCCLIHDSQSDKKSFIADLRAGYERLLGDDPEPADPEAARDTVVRRIDEEFTALRRLTEAMTGLVPAAGRTGIELVNHLVQLRASLGDQPELTAEQAEVLPVPLDWWPAASCARRLERNLAELGQDPVLATHPIAGVGAGILDAERPARAARELCEQARQDLAEAEAVAGGVPVMSLPLADVLAISAAAVRIAPLAREQATDLLDAGSRRSRRFDALARAQETKVAALGAARAAASGWRQPVPPGEVGAAVQLARAKEGRPLSFLSGRWRALKKQVAAGYGGPGGVTAALELLATVQHAQAELDEVTAAARTELGIDDLPGTTELVRGLRPLTTSPHRRLAAFATRVAADRSGTEALAWASIHPAVAALKGTLGALLADPDGYLFGELAEVVDGVSAELDLLPVLLDGLRELAEAPAGVRRALRELPFPADVIEYAAAHRTLRDWFAQDRAVARLDGEAIERRLEAIGHLRRELLERNAACVSSRARGRFRANIAMAATSATQLSPEQKSFKKQYTAGRRELEHEFGKSMRYRSIRDLADGATGAVLRDLKPVWLMSPLSVSDTLPLTAGLFDVVVFDEASQVPLEDAVPSLYRAPQVIVVGDEMQLPPTSFFTAASADVDELVADEDGERISVTLDSDSFLNHANANLPSSLLSWHYRSQFESLISFSNAAFYRGQLRTIPDRGQQLAGRPPLSIRSAEQAADTAEALLDRPISFHLLEHGVYSQRHNLPEAQYVAGLVRELLQRGTGRSLGIVAFSEAQQSAIEDALARLAASDPGFAILLDAESEREEDGQYVGLFVKNLENVQGDERDIVILSTCYGRDPAGKMRMNFGPINSSGGEKRLNVIFSRAKHHMAVVSSIRHTDITNDWNDGASALKGYLRYAEACSAGDAATARAVLDGLSPRAGQSAFRPGIVAEQLAAALRGGGLVADLGVGQSGFRCDLAVRRPDVEDYQLAVLVDSQPGAHGNEQERYVDRPRALHSTGWAVAHVLAKDWLADPAQVTERLTRIVTR